MSDSWWAGRESDEEIQMGARSNCTHEGQLDSSLATYPSSLSVVFTEQKVILNIIYQT